MIGLALRVEYRNVSVQHTKPAPGCGLSCSNIKNVFDFNDAQSKCDGREIIKKTRSFLAPIINIHTAHNSKLRFTIAEVFNGLSHGGSFQVCKKSFNYE